MKDTLQLVLKTKFFWMIGLGAKTEEYREITPYWFVRIYAEYLPDVYGKYEARMIDSETAKFYCDPSRRRLFRQAIRRGRFIPRHNAVTFYEGYNKNRKSMTWTIKDTFIGSGKTDWGADPHKKYFVIKLDKVIQYTDNSFGRTTFSARND